MKLTSKDKQFLDRLRPFLAAQEVKVQLREDGPKRLVLRQNYGAHIEAAFGMTRQGIRWRFQRLMDMYVSAYETILFVESGLGTELRAMAMAVARDRAKRRKRVTRLVLDGNTGGKRTW